MLDMPKQIKWELFTIQFTQFGLNLLEQIYRKKPDFHIPKWKKFGLMTPLVELNCKYYSPAYYDDELIVTATVSKLTPARVVFSYEVYRQNSDKPLCTGYTVHALVNKDMKPTNVKKNFPEIYNIMEKMMD